MKKMSKTKALDEIVYYAYRYFEEWQEDLDSGVLCDDDTFEINRNNMLEAEKVLRGRKTK